MKSLKMLFLAAPLVLLSGAVASASGMDYVLTGSGTWNSSTPVTALSAPNETWSFSVMFPDPITNGVAVNSADVSTTSGINFVYYLNGVMVNATLTEAQFYSTAEDGLFDLTTSVGIFDGYGPQVDSNTAPTLTLTPGTYTGTADVNLSDEPTGHGAATYHIGVVPEPATLLLLGTGFFAAGFAGLLYQRKASKLLALSPNRSTNE
jgi:hypothetical protein